MEEVEIKLMQFGSFVQADLDLLLTGQVENVKAFANRSAFMLADSAIFSFGYKVNMPYRVINQDLFRYPKTWWDHFKESNFPYWAKRRWPVEYETIEFEIRECYPLLKWPETDKKIFFINKLEAPSCNP